MNDESQPQPPENPSDLNRPDPQRFNADIDALLKRAEEMRLSRMKRMRNRNNFTLTLSIVFLVAGASGFGWFLLMEADIVRAVGSIALAAAVPLLLNLMAARGLEEYRRAYKEEFLPDLAKALGGFRFSPTRGISPNIIAKTGVLPGYEAYNAEDCFTGRYRGVKVIFSEARLYGKKKKAEPVFRGILVLLETPEALIEGHTIVTADTAMYDKWRHTRWKKLQDVEIRASEPDYDRFRVVASNPEAARLLVGERLLKELSEAADVFGQAPLTAVLFQEKFVFVAIPYAGDLFEPSDIHMPVATRRHILQIRREVEQIFQIIDIFDLYSPHAGERTPSPEKQ